MRTGPGAPDAQGVYHYGEADNPDGSFSGLMDLALDSISDQFDSDRTELAAHASALTPLPHAMAAGLVASPGGGSSSPPVYYDNSVSVTLPVGRFTQTPIITATSDARATGGVPVGCGISSVSATSFVLRQTRLGAAPAGFYANWTAVQMTPTSGAG